MNLGNLVYYAIIIFFVFRIVRGGGCCGGHRSTQHEKDVNTSNVDERLKDYSIYED